MGELRRDVINGRWVIIDTGNDNKTLKFEKEKHHTKGAANCPFCYGNEHMTPPEIDAHREGGTEPNTSGWSTRVVPNKFAALQIEGDLDNKGIGLYDISNGIGAHEVIIENPDHNKEICDLLDHDVEKVIWAYRDRYVDLKGDKRFKYILIFKNYGRSAGTSLEHPHSQIISLPIVPKSVKEESRGAQTYFGYRERCIFCDMINQEIQDAERLITENESFLCFAPFASRFPYEAWIIPKKHKSNFCLIKNDGVVELARILKETLLRIKKTLDDPSYNFIIHTSPLEDKDREDYHWHIEIMPRLIRIAGFEWGSGFYINPVSPEKAAEDLKKIKL